MRGTPPPGGPAAKGGPKGGGNAGAWIRKHKAVVIGGGAVAAVGALYLISSSGSGSAAAPSSGTTAATGTSAGPDPSVYSGGYGSYGDGGQSSDYAAEMSQLQSFLNNYTASTAPATATSGGGGTTTTTPPKTTTQPPAAKGKVSPPIKIVKPKTPANQTITVQKGQTLASLSQKYFGTSNRTQLAHMNGLGTGAGLRTGQRLKV